MPHISPMRVCGAIMYTWYAEASGKRAWQMACRQSDGRIVPVMARSPLGIIAGGKLRTWRFPLSTAIQNKLKGETLATLRR